MLIKTSFVFTALVLLSFFIPTQTYAACTIPTSPTCWTGDSRCASGQQACNGINESGGACVACRSTGVTQRLTCSDPTSQGGTCNNVCGAPGATSNCYTQVDCDENAGVFCTGISGDGCNYCVAPVCSGGCGIPGCPACPTPTPTPTPTPLPAPAFIPASTGCSADGTTISYSWNSITNAVRYAIRIDDRTNIWDANNALAGDTIDNNVAQTSYSRSSTPGATYDAWVHAVDSRGVYSDSSTHSIFTCPVPGATATPGPVPTSSIPTPTPIPGCVSCGGGSGYCGGSPATAANFPAACPNCPSASWNWYNSGADDATCSSAPQGNLYPYCWVCSVPLPTATPDPLATPTPTTPAGCTWNEGAGGCDQQSEIGKCTYQGCVQAQKTCQGECRYDDSSGQAQSCTIRTQVGIAECLSTSSCGNSGTRNQRIGLITWSGPAGSCPTAAPTPTTYTVPGIVFIDRNGDGIRQPEGYDRAQGTSDDEIGYTGGARLFLGTQSTTTDTNGAYQFTGVTSGSYTLELDVPFGFSPNKSTGYDVTTGTNKLTFTIPPAVTSADFGIVPYEVGVGGTMYTTVESNCSTSITSLGRLGSKSLSLSETYFGQTFNAATDINGVYSFSYPNQTLFPGNYSLTPSGGTGMQLVCAVVDPGTASATVLDVRSTPYTYGPFDLTAQNPQKRVDFYYKLGRPWFQGKGGDMRIDSGFIDPVPNSNNTFAMLSNSRSPGVIFSGGNRYSFCTSGAGACLERASPLTNPWVVGGTTYPAETFTPAIPGTTRTAYNYLLGLVRKNGQAINEIPATRNCYETSGCDLAALDPDIVYTNTPGRDVYIRGAGSTFNRGDYVFLFDRNLNIQGDIRVTGTSTLTVSVSGDITVNKDVGGGTGAHDIHIEGFYSADKSFIVNSEAGTNAVGSNCTTTPPRSDKRLNMAGAVVVNAKLDGGGTFDNRRSLCNDNDNPTFYIEESPYLILNAPDFIKHKSFVWQEVAP